MKDLVIVCEDSFGLDVKMIVDAVNLHKSNNGEEKSYNIIGYICPADVSDRLRFTAMPFLSTIEDYLIPDGIEFVMGIVKPDRKEKYVRFLKTRNAKFTGLLAPWILGPKPESFGEGSIIAARNIKVKAEIGAFVTLFYTMTDSAKIGDYSSIMAYSNLTLSEIGERVYIAPNCVIWENVIVEDHAYICPNSIVVKNVKANTKVSGVPARKVKA